MKQIPDKSIDACVTDPPYELGFMGKSWDNTGIAYKVELWREVLRVLKPGGHLLSFGGSRTYHRMACAIEDAGFEIRDQIMWVYGSGFPKSLNIGKAVDKIQGNEREVVGIDDGRSKYDGAERKQRTEDNRLISTGQDRVMVTTGTSAWEGYGTALKPAHEPICVARKPIEGTVAENCLKWGVGGLNIDGCRVGSNPRPNIAPDRGRITGNSWNGGIDGSLCGSKSIGKTTQGRFPANLILSWPEDVYELRADITSGDEDKAKRWLIDNGITI